MLKKIRNTVMMSFHVILYVFDMGITILLDQLHIISSERADDEVINAIARYYTAISKYVSRDLYYKLICSTREKSEAVYNKLMEVINTD